MFIFVPDADVNCCGWLFQLSLWWFTLFLFSQNGAVYSLPNTASNYGLVVTGIRDTNAETIPVRVDTNVNYEDPEIGMNSDVRPAAMAVTLTITVTNTATDGATNFVLYRYSSLAAVPEKEFSKNSASASNKWSISVAKGETYTLTEKIQSDEVAVYRCVRA